MRINKRLLFGFLLTLVLAVSGGVMAQDEEIPITFTIWTFDVEQVQEYINDWEASSPYPVQGILNDVDWGQYNETLTAQFVSGTAPDVMYASDHWLQTWASAGWLIPLKEVFPEDEVNALVDGMFPFTLEGMTYNGEIYGLPYYSDPIAFVYNTRMYEEAGIEEAPQTWEDVLEHARIMKDAGVVNYPIGFGWAQNEPFSIEVVTAILMSRGDEFFDDDLNPTFITEDGEPIMDSALAQHIEWVKAALDEGLMDPESLTRDGVINGQSIMAGTQAYAMTRASGLAAWQDPDTSAEAGNLEMIIIPGETGQTLGFVRFYAVTSNMLDRDEEARAAAWDFMKYFGGPGPDGDYPVVREWALKWGLGFGPIALYEDEEIRTAFSHWTDVDLLEEVALNASARRLSPWYASWDVFTRAELQRAYLGQVSVEDALVNIANQWASQRADYED
jgi:multiple sugar transport system substrate-binding protein